jgi:hypothetical protein
MDERRGRQDHPAALIRGIVRLTRRTRFAK